MKVEIVNHTHRYARLLGWQLSSLVRHHAGHDLTYTVYYDPLDAETVRTLAFFTPLIPKNVKMQLRERPISVLRNRAVGRNEAAEATEADWIWFTDTDYMFIDRCWEMLAEETKTTTAQLVWPSSIWETDWPTGDRLIREMNTLAPMNFLFSDTYQKRMHKAIGGIQIVRGDYARDFGYCPDYQGERDEWDFRSDVRFRHRVRKLKEINLWHTVRIRHSQRGYGQPDRHEVAN